MSDRQIPTQKIKFQLNNIKFLAIPTFVIFLLGCVNNGDEIAPSHLGKSKVWTNHYTENEIEEDPKTRTDIFILDEKNALYVKSLEWSKNDLSFISAFVKAANGDSEKSIDCSDIIYRELVDKNQRFEKSNALENIITKFLSGFSIRPGKLRLFVANA